MPDEAEFRCGALYCSKCKRRFYYRTHILPGSSAEDEVYRCPDCGHELHEIPVNTFLDSTEETLQVIQMLDEEAREENPNI